MTRGRATHRERVRPPWWVWLICGGLAALLSAEVALAGGPVPGVIAVVVLSVALGAGLRAWALDVEVDDEALQIGPARVPLTATGSLTPLSGEQLRLRSGRDADPAAHVALRPWLHSALEVAISDPDDPTPYLLVGSADPARLAAAISARRTTE